MADIIIKNLCKAYGDNQVLNQFSALFPHGKTSCIMAPSGGGKTTLLRILMQLETPDSGSISGLDIATLRAVFQEDRLCESLTAEANIRLPSPKLSKGAVYQAMEAVGLKGCEEQAVSSLSGGMRRRVSILRAILAQYEMLLLDEPFKGLDAETKNIVIAYTKEMTANKTVVLITHDNQEWASLGASTVIEL